MRGRRTVRTVERTNVTVRRTTVRRTTAGRRDAPRRPRAAAARTAGMAAATIRRGRNVIPRGVRVTSPGGRAVVGGTTSVTAPVVETVGGRAVTGEATAGVRSAVAGPMVAAVGSRAMAGEAIAAVRSAAATPTVATARGRAMAGEATAVVRSLTAATAGATPAVVNGAGNRVVVRSVVDVHPGRAITRNDLPPPRRRLRLRGLVVNRRQMRCTVTAVAKSSKKRQQCAPSVGFPSPGVPILGAPGLAAPGRIFRRVGSTNSRRSRVRARGPSPSSASFSRRQRTSWSTEWGSPRSASSRRISPSLVT